MSDIISSQSPIAESNLVECTRKRIAELETALRAIITHCETHSDGSWTEDEPWLIAKRALQLETPEHRRIAELEAALEPFAAAVFNDNHDVTITTSHIHTNDYLRAKRMLERK